MQSSILHLLWLTPGKQICKGQSVSGCGDSQVKQQTVKERQQAELRLEEAHQAEENAVAQLQSLRKDCRQVCTPCKRVSSFAWQYSYNEH